MAYLKLIRIGNVLFIGFFQLLLRWGLILPILEQWGIEPAMTTMQFVILVVATMSIAASGNAINDYFDVRCDSINRPDTQVVDKLIDRKVAILIHVVLSLVGVFCGLYISFVFRKESYALMFIAVPILLWFYSTHFKKQMLIGNLIVALLTALVAFLVVSAEIAAIVAAGQADILQNEACRLAWGYTAVFAFFAFTTNLAREIVKDMEDIDGDIECGGHTIPIEMGMRNSKIVVVLLQLLIIVVLWLAYFDVNAINSVPYLWLYLVLCITIPILLVIYLTIKAQNNKNYHTISKLCKVVMFLGILPILLMRLVFKM